MCSFAIVVQFSDQICATPITPRFSLCTSCTSCVAPFPVSVVHLWLIGKPASGIWDHPLSTLTKERLQRFSLKYRFPTNSCLIYAPPTEALRLKRILLFQVSPQQFADESSMARVAGLFEETERQRGEVERWREGEERWSCRSREVGRITSTSVSTREFSTCNWGSDSNGELLLAQLLTHGTKVEGSARREES